MITMFTMLRRLIVLLTYLTSMEESFSNKFLESQENFLAVQSLKRIQRKSSPVELYTLFIQGDDGVGKTHILNHMIKNLKECDRVVYINSNKFKAIISEASSKFKNLESIKRICSQADYLIIDNFHSLDSSNIEQEKIFKIVNAMVMLGKRVIVTSKCHIHEFNNINIELQNILISGLCVEIQTPTKELRYNLLQHLFSKESLVVRQDVLEKLSQLKITNLNELKGIVHKAKLLDISEIEVTFENIKSVTSTIWSH